MCFLGAIIILIGYYIDQAHKQTNKLMKSKSGLANVLNKEDSRLLRKLENTITEINCYLEEFEGEAKSQGHNETSSNFVRSNINETRMVRGRISINPFLEKGLGK